MAMGLTLFQWKSWMHNFFLAFFLHSFCLSGTALANQPQRPFPHGQENKAPADGGQDDEALPDVQADESTHPCTLDFQTWLKRQEAPSPHPKRAENYLFEAQVMKRMGALLEEWPGLMTAQCIGRTVRRHPIWSFSIENPTISNGHTVLVFAQLHALEWLGTEVVVELAESLSASAPAGVKVVLVPIVNPDGRARVEKDLVNERIGVYRRANANGVDLNRDWGANREITSIWSKMPFTSRYYYYSQAPVSQPESQALDKLAEAIQPDAVVSLHAFGGYIYYPWGGLREPTADQDEIHRQALVMSSAQTKGGYISVQLGMWAFWFKAHGVEIDHFYSKYGASSFIIELSHSGINLFDWDTVRDFFRWYNPKDPKPHVQDGHNAVRALIYDYSHRAQRTQGPAAP
jgi:hypothetical protein